MHQDSRQTFYQNCSKNGLSTKSYHELSILGGPWTGSRFWSHSKQTNQPTKTTSGWNPQKKTSKGSIHAERQVSGQSQIPSPSFSPGRLQLWLLMVSGHSKTPLPSQLNRATPQMLGHEQLEQSQKSSSAQVPGQSHLPSFRKPAEIRHSVPGHSKICPVPAPRQVMSLPCRNPGTRSKVASS